MDEGYTWRDHVIQARIDIDEADFNDGFSLGNDAMVRESLFNARAALTRAIAMLPKPKVDDAA